MFIFDKYDFVFCLSRPEPENLYFIYSEFSKWRFEMNIGYPMYWKTEV